MSAGARFGSKLKELRLHLCQTGEHSAGVRDFINKHYVDLKQANPKFPFLIRECSGIQPRVWARYEKGKEVSESLTNKTADEVLQKVNSLAS